MQKQEQNKVKAFESIKIKDTLTPNNKEIEVEASVKMWEYGNYREREKISVSEKEKECLLKNIINRFIFNFYNLSEIERENIKRVLNVTESITLDRWENKLDVYIKLKERTSSQCKTLIFENWINYRTIVEVNPQSFLNLLNNF